MCIRDRAIREKAGVISKKIEGKPLSPEKIEKELLAVPIVQEVVYDKSLIKLLNDNLKKVSYTLLLLSLFFSAIAIALINS